LFIDPDAIWVVDAATGATAIIAMTASTAINAVVNFILVSPQLINLGSVKLFTAPQFEQANDFLVGRTRVTTCDLWLQYGQIPDTHALNLA
jgi:hypothetical protein